MLTSNFLDSFRGKRKGFTLLEIIIVISIITVLSSLLLGYSQRNSKQIALATNQAKLASLLSRAKALSIQTFFQAQGPDEAICGYGVRFNINQQKAFIFQDIDTPGKDGSRCSRDINDYKYNKNRDFDLSGELNVLSLAGKGIEMSADGSYVIFIPPDPLVSFGDDEIEKLTVTLSDEIITLGVTISEDGQIKLE